MLIESFNTLSSLNHHSRRVKWILLSRRRSVCLCGSYKCFTEEVNLNVGRRGDGSVDSQMMVCGRNGFVCMWSERHVANYFITCMQTAYLYSTMQASYVTYYHNVHLVGSIRYVCVMSRFEVLRSVLQWESLPATNASACPSARPSRGEWLRVDITMLQARILSPTQTKI
jgi:hypothetical protein